MHEHEKNYYILGVGQNRAYSALRRKYRQPEVGSIRVGTVVIRNGSRTAVDQRFIDRWRDELKRLEDRGILKVLAPKLDPNLIPMEGEGEVQSDEGTGEGGEQLPNSEGTSSTAEGEQDPPASETSASEESSESKEEEASTESTSEEASKEEEEAPQEDTKPKIDLPAGWETLVKRELLALMEKNGIAVPERQRNEDLIAEIRKAAGLS